MVVDVSSIWINKKKKKKNKLSLRLVHVVFRRTFVWFTLLSMLDSLNDTHPLGQLYWILPVDIILKEPFFPESWI